MADDAQKILNERLNFAHPDYLSQARKWGIMEDVYAGEFRIKSFNKISEYLPKMDLENKSTYENRIKISRFYNAFKRAIHGLVGLVFRKAPTTGIPFEENSILNRSLNNIDRQGATIESLAMEAMTLFFRRGHVFLLVDRPPFIGEKSMAEAEESIDRPFIRVLDPMSVTNWRCEYDENGIQRLTMANVLICDYAPKGGDPYIVEKRERRIVYEPGMFTEYTRDSNGNWFMTKTGPMLMSQEPLKTIPIFPIYGEKISPMVSDPGLIDLALENIRHFQIDTDNRFAGSLLSYPIACFSGVKEDEIEGTVGAGPERGLRFRDPQATWGYLETSGNAPAVTEKQLVMSEQKMAVYSLRMLDPREEKVQKTLGEKRMNSASEHSILATITNNFSREINKALIFFKEWAGDKTGAEPDFTLNTDYTALMMDPQILTTLKEMQMAGQLSLDTLWNLMREGEINLPENEVLKQELVDDGVWTGKPTPSTTNEDPEKEVVDFTQQNEAGPEEM